MQEPALRSLLKALGHDPATHLGFRRERIFPGLQISDEAGNPVRFYTARTLRKLQSDYSFCRHVQTCTAEELERDAAKVTAGSGEAKRGQAMSSASEAEIVGFDAGREPSPPATIHTSGLVVTDPPA